MSAEQTNGAAATTNGTSSAAAPDFTVKAGLAQMLKGGVIMDVVNAEQVAHSPRTRYISLRKMSADIW